MKSTTLSSLIDHLAELSFIKWVDIDEGQLDVPERPPVAFPCILLEMGYTAADTHQVRQQRVKATIELRVAFYPSGATNSATPKVVRNKSLARFDQLEELHQHLQGWRPEGCLLPLRRERSTPELRGDGLKVYNCTYTTELMA